MAKLCTEEMNKIIEEARDEALIQSEEGCSAVVESMNNAFNNGVKVAVSTIQHKLAHHDYEELMKHDE